MYLEQIYTQCLAEAAYYIESAGEAAIIDPLREVQPYLDKAGERNAKIRYIFETHFHADFVSGHVDLAKKTGAQIVFGPLADTEYEIHNAIDGEEFKLGNVTIRALHTPGHTLESTTYLLIDEQGKEHAIFTGDTLFIGDVGRPDLAVSTAVTMDRLAGMLFDSLRTKIMPLGNDVIVYPAHGAGSACGKNISEATYSTLGEQKRTNFALQDISREEFIKEVTEGILPAPQYFPKNVMLNKNGYQSIDQVMERGVKALSVEATEAAVANGALILDTREKTDFAKAFIPGSMFIGLSGSFAVWVGTLIPDIDKKIVVITEAGREKEAVMRLARVGYDNALGYLEGGLKAWQEAGRKTDSIESISAADLEKRLAGEDINLIDVRKPSEYETEHVGKALNFPLDFIGEKMDDLDPGKAYHVHCRSGYRSVIACSILRANGFKHLVDISGGFLAMKETGIPKSEFVCQSTLKTT